MRCVLSVLTLLSINGVAVARDFSAYMLDADEELRLAATAAPGSVTAGATFYRLGTEGFVVEVEGDNGWHCFVQRAFFFPREDRPDEFDTSVRAPHCINSDGATSRMQEIFMRTQLALSGAEASAIDAKINAAYADGTLQPPSGFAMTYMMSPEQWLGATVGAWKPHLMFWLPYLENSAAGNNPPMGELPFIGADSGTRAAVLVVPVAPLE